MPSARRFPPPWTIDEANDACFIVKDHNGHALAYVYFEQEPGRRTAANLLTRDEAWRIAANIAKLPDLLGKAPPTGDNRLAGPRRPARRRRVGRPWVRSRAAHDRPHSRGASRLLVRVAAPRRK